MGLVFIDPFKIQNNWLSAIPEHWGLQRNKNIFFEVAQLSETGQETLLTVSHITGVTPRSEKNVNMFFASTHVGYKLCEPGDLIINTMWAWMGALGTSKYFGICSPAYNVYRNHKSVPYHQEYFEYLFRTPNSIVEMTRYSRGIVASRLRLYPKDFFQIISPLPPFAEQAMIATYLNKKIKAIDCKRDILECKFRTYGSLMRAISLQVIRKGLDKTKILQDSGVDWIGDIPAHWKVLRFKSFANTIKGKSYQFFDEYNEGAVPNLSLDFLRNDDPKFIRYCYATDKSHIVNESDYLIVWDGAGVGEILKGKFGAISSTLAKLTFNIKIMNPRYFYHLRHSLEYKLKNIPTGMGIPHLNPHILNNFLCPIPPIEEQDLIAEYLDEKANLIDSIRSNISSQLDALKEFRKHLISNIVLGRVSINDEI